jgi:hypothetical protein
VCVCVCVATAGTTQSSAVISDAQRVDAIKRAGWGPTRKRGCVVVHRATWHQSLPGSSQALEPWHTHTHTHTWSDTMQALESWHTHTLSLSLTHTHTHTHGQTPRQAESPSSRASVSKRGGQYAVAHGLSKVGWGWRSWTLEEGAGEHGAHTVRVWERGVGCGRLLKEGGK